MPVVELTVLARHPAAFSDPDWGFALECDDCASTDVDDRLVNKYRDAQVVIEPA